MLIRLGLSPCPNDTWLAHGILTGAVRPRGFELELVFADVQELNERLARGELLYSKGSYHLALLESERLDVLAVGSAIGFGVGPLLLGRPQFSREELQRADGQSPLKVLSPGGHTTAHFLWRLFFGAAHAQLIEGPFHEIMPALAESEADLGIVIHEGRFTYASSALQFIEDLGTRYETDTGMPLPLGGLFVDRWQEDSLILELCDTLRASLRCAEENPAAAMATMQRYAQELDPEVIQSHVALYVNDWTRDLGRSGEAAIRAFERAAKTSAIIPSDARPLAIRGASGASQLQS